MASPRKAAYWGFIAIAAATLALGGCKKSSKGGSGATGASKAALSAFGYLPKDASSLFGISSALNKSLLRGAASSQLKAKLPAQFKAIKAQCGIDILEELTSIVGSAGTNQKDMMNQYVVATGSFDKKKINDCVNKATIDGKKLSAKEDGKLTAYGQAGSNRVIYAYWPSANTVVFSPGANNKAGVQARIDQKKSVKDNARLMALVKDVDTTAMVWAVGDIKVPRVEQPDGVIVHLNGKNSLELKLRLRYADKGGADKTKNMLNDLLSKAKSNPMINAFIGPLLTDLKVSTSGRDTVINLNLSEAQMKKAMQLFKQFGSMMMGGRRR